jgi:hypothetical protein
MKHGAVSPTRLSNFTRPLLLVPWRIKHVTTCPLEIVSFAGTDASEKNYAKLIADNIEKLAKAVEKGAGALRDAH